MKVYRKKWQTKFIKDGFEGLLTLHDSGKFAVSIDHKALFDGLEYEEMDSYYVIQKPTTGQKNIIMDRLFDFNA
jgi:hypothetical protein